jgi:hypothetical protein
MLDRIILSAALSVTGYNGLFPDPPTPLTPSQLQVKAKEKSISEMCNRKPQSKAAKDLCSRWKKQQGFL